MRTLQALSIVCLLIYGVTAEPAKGKSHQLSGLRQHLERAKTCSLQCVKGEGSVETSKNWVVRLDVNIYLLYSSENNYIAIYNVNLGIAVVYDSVSGILIIVNVKTGDSLLIRYQIVYFVKGSGAVTQFNEETGVYDGVDVCYQIIIKYKAQLIANPSTTTGSCFSVTILLEYLYNLEGEIDLTTVVNGRTDLALKLKAAFGIYFQSVSTSLKKGDVAIAAGGFVLVGVVFDLSKNLSIYQFFYVIYVKQIVITVQIIEIFYNSVTENNTSKITAIAALLFNVGVLYDDSVSAFIAYRAGYFGYLRTTVNINGQSTLLIFSRDSNTKAWNIYFRNSKSSFVIGYCSTTNSLIFLNFTYNLVYVFPSKGGFWLIYNGQTGIAIAVGKLLGTAKVVDTNAAAIAAAYKVGNLKLSVELMIAVAVKVSIGLFEYRFVFVDFLYSIQKLGVEYTYKLNADTKAKIDANFNALIVNYKGIEGFSYLEGSVNGLLIVFKGFHLGFLTRQCVLLVSIVCIKSSVFFNGSIMAEVYFSIQFSVSVSFSSSSIFKVVGGGGSNSSSSYSSSWSSGGGSSSSWSVGGGKSTSVVYGG